MARNSAGRGGLTADSFNTKGPVPGSTRAISQRKAVSDGYEVAGGPRHVKTNQEEGMTGKSDAPGFTSRMGGKRKGPAR